MTVHHLVALDEVDAAHVVRVLHEAAGQVVDTLIILVLAEESIVVEALRRAELVHVIQQVVIEGQGCLWRPLGQLLGGIVVQLE